MSKYSIEAFMNNEKTDFDKKRNDFLKELMSTNSDLVDIRDISFENDDVPLFLQKLEKFEDRSRNVSLIIK